MLGWLPLVVAACSPAKPPKAPADGAEAAALDPHVGRVENGLEPAGAGGGAALRSSIAERMRALRVPALSVAVVVDYKIEWARAYGVADAATGEAATAETLFQAGSISKALNALATLSAAAEGALALDAPINDALTTWKLPDAGRAPDAPVTLRRLLSHTAGTTVHGFPGYVAGRPLPTLHQVLAGAPPATTPAVRVERRPGSYRYSGGGTTVVQLALVERLGRPYPQILAERVLRPLGMAQSTFEQPLPPERLKRAAAGHGGDGRPIEGKRRVYPEMAAAGLWTTPSDLARFFVAVALARAGRPSPVPAAIAAQMTAGEAELGRGRKAGLGVFLSELGGAGYFGHGGSDEGFRADAVMSLEGGRGVVVMANGERGDALVDEVRRAVFAAYGWAPEAEAPRAALADVGAAGPLRVRAAPGANARLGGRGVGAGAKAPLGGRGVGVYVSAYVSPDGPARRPGRRARGRPVGAQNSAGSLCEPNTSRRTSQTSCSVA